MYRSLFPRDLFAELDRLQRDAGSLFDLSPSIRGSSRGAYPALNVGSSAEAVEVYAFAPGLDPASISVDLERGVLSLSGERAAALPAGEDAGTSLHQNERFSGRFRRVVSLPDDIDADSVNASYRDGVLRVSIRRRAPQQARRINVQ
ncbi:Hsp20/alpha crystallin family protein [Pelomonas sp. CA6]|uniref:Hsp20/alpha crystallin family protein n=1 Tax=Pelomonas sp. CA6 TaxID=2907999 RepID=UPI001F4C10DD|nr:Hsp20/alpha crystallin family protein [Pelomonas sp. CA6]MCH7343209.1 Hsp20/alpha crystallin family protein [Pelomonas sp. CA6]